MFLFCEYVASGGANGIACSGKRRPVAQTVLWFCEYVGAVARTGFLLFEYETTGSNEYERGL